VFNSGSPTVTIGQDVTVNSLTVTGAFGGTLTFAQGVAANLTISNNLYLKSGATIVPTYSRWSATARAASSPSG